MATRTQSRSQSSPSSTRSTSTKRASSSGSTASRNRSNASGSNNKSSSSDKSSNSSERSAFSFGGSTSSLIGAALAGAAIGFAANYARKGIMQGMEAAIGDWDEILATEHDATLAILDKMLATDETQTFKRKMLLMQVTHALDKHAHQEEMVVYPALRRANNEVEADQLEEEHGDVKTCLYELGEKGTDSPTWLETVRGLRSLVSRHAHMEEEEVFPRFKQNLSEEQNARITSLVNRDGFWMA